MGRKLKIDVSVPMLTPQWPFMDSFTERDKEYNKAKKQIYDQQHKARPLDPDTPVWIRTGSDHPTTTSRNPKVIHCGAT